MPEPRQTGNLNAELLRECRRLCADERAGRHWSAANYAGGYTSHGSAHKMHRMSPTFETPRRLLSRHVAEFVRVFELDVTGRPLEMTDCWLNIMPRAVAHGSRQHQHQHQLQLQLVLAVRRRPRHSERES